MTRGVALETCWDFNKLWNNKFYYKVACIMLVFLLSHLLCMDPWISKNGKKICVNMLKLVFKCYLCWQFKGWMNGNVCRIGANHCCGLSTLCLHSPDVFSTQAAAENCFRTRFEFPTSIWLPPDTPQDVKRSVEIHSSQVTLANRGRS
jgi:hypothetical protein